MTGEPPPPAEPPAPAVPAGPPPAEVDIDSSLVRALLAAQHPDLAGLPLAHAATGWDNATYRLGDRLAVRLPRIAAGVPLLRNEQRWLPVLAPRLPIPVPAPVWVGRPGAGFPWPWSVVPWIPGRSAEHGPPAPSEAAAFGRFLAAVHRPTPEGFPRNHYRGVPLAQVADRFAERMRALAAAASVAAPAPAIRDAPPRHAVWDRWRAALAAPASDRDVWVHGDLHPKNVVVDDGRLAAVLDWGDMTAGDPAVDLGAAWMLFPTEAHDQVWAAYGAPSPATLLRARGWAVYFGAILLHVGLGGDPAFAEIGRRTLTRACQ